MKAIASLPPRTKRILSIDQSQNCRQMLTHLLECAGYEVETADTVADGLRFAKRERFDLYIVENRFIDGSGIELCQLLHALHPHIPILFFSSSARISDARAGIAAGAQQYLTKPMGIYLIEQTIADLLVRPVEVRAYI